MLSISCLTNNMNLFNTAILNGADFSIKILMSDFESNVFLNVLEEKKCSNLPLFDIACRHSGIHIIKKIYDNINLNNVSQKNIYKNISRNVCINIDDSLFKKFISDISKNNISDKTLLIYALINNNVELASFLINGGLFHLSENEYKISSILDDVNTNTVNFILGILDPNKIFSQEKWTKKMCSTENKIVIRLYYEQHMISCSLREYFSDSIKKLNESFEERKVLIQQDVIDIISHDLFCINSKKYHHGIKHPLRFFEKNYEHISWLHLLLMMHEYHIFYYILDKLALNNIYLNNSIKKIYKISYDRSFKLDTCYFKRNIIEYPLMHDMHHAIKYMIKHKLVINNDIYVGRSTVDLLYHILDTYPGKKMDVLNTIYPDKFPKISQPFVKQILLLLVKISDIDLLKFCFSKGLEIVRNNNFGEKLIMYACSRKNCNVLKYLDKKYYKLNEDNINNEINGSTYLMNALKTSYNFKTIKYLVDKKADISDKKLLSSAVLNVNVKTINLLIENNADVNYVDSCGFTPIYNSHVKNIDTLIMHGADLNYKSHNDITVFHYACLSLKKNVVIKLIDYGIDVNLPCQDSAHTLPLFCLFNRGPRIGLCNLKDIIRHLIDAKCDINLKNLEGDNIINFIASKNRKELVPYIREILEIFRSNGLDFNSKNIFGETPIIKYIKHNGSPDMDIIRAFLESGADINIPDSDGSYIFNENNKILPEVYISYADVNKYNFNGLFHIIMSKNVKIINSLVEKKININMVDENNNTVIHKYYLNEYNNDFYRYFPKNINLNIVNNDKCSLLHVILHKSNCLSLNVYIIDNCDIKFINMANLSGKTPLHLACEVPFNNDTIEYLLSKKADINYINTCAKYDQTALAIAQKRRDDKLINLLLLNGANYFSSHDNSGFFIFYERFNLDEMKNFLSNNDINIFITKENKSFIKKKIINHDNDKSDIILHMLKNNHITNINLIAKSISFYSVMCNNLELLEAMIKEGVDINTPNKYGVTLVMCAASYPNKSDTLKFLIEHNDKIKHTSRELLSIACKNMIYENILTIVNSPNCHYKPVLNIKHFTGTDSYVGQNNKYVLGCMYKNKSNYKKSECSQNICNNKDSFDDPYRNDLDFFIDSYIDEFVQSGNDLNPKSRASYLNPRFRTSCLNYNDYNNYYNEENSEDHEYREYHEDSEDSENSEDSDDYDNSIDGSGYTTLKNSKLFFKKLQSCRSISFPFQKNILFSIIVIVKKTDMLYNLGPTNVRYEMIWKRKNYATYDNCIKLNIFYLMAFQYFNKIRLPNPIIDIIISRAIFQKILSYYQFGPMNTHYNQNRY